MTEPMTLGKDYGYEQFKISGLKSSVIDASDASWIVANMGSNINLYPVLVSDSAGVTLLGGTINGEVSLDMERVDLYVNSAAIFMRDTKDAVIRDWTIKQAWDGIRIRGSDHFTIDRVWMTGVRDDAVENDDGLSGTIRNSLLDGVFVGLSTADSRTSKQTQNVVIFDDVLIRMEKYLDHGKLTHQSPFKVTSNSPSMKIYDSVIAIEDVNHIGQARLAEAWKKTVDASGNYFLNLSDKPLPSSYPTPPKGFTVLQGAEARKFWEAARSDWIAEFTGEDPDAPPTGSEAGMTEIIGTSGNDKISGGDSNDSIMGKAGNDILMGNGGDDILRGQDGHDQLKGGLGADILIGGTGNDTFRFSRVSDSTSKSYDIVRADSTGVVFEGAGGRGGDVFDLRDIDANWKVSGNQAFVFDSIKRGGLSLVDVNGNTHVRGNTDDDAAFEFVVVIEDGAVSAADYAAIDFLL